MIFGFRISTTFLQQQRWHNHCSFDRNTLELTVIYPFSIKRVYSSIFSLPAFPEVSINKFLFHFMASSYVEETTCCKSVMERFPQIFVSVDGCTVILWIFILLVFSLGLHFFWCWIKPLEVLKFLLHVACRVVSCLVESLLFCTSPFFGCWFAECSLFRWSRILSSELMCENSLFMMFFIINKRTYNWSVFLALKIFSMHSSFFKVQVPTGLILW